MKFTKELPRTRRGSYYLWYVDREYPVPKIGFYTTWNHTLYLDTSCSDHKIAGLLDKRLDRYRFGDMIEEPDTQTNEIE